MSSLVCSGPAGSYATQGNAAAIGVALPPPPTRISPGFTAHVVQGSASVTFSEAVTLPEGTPLVFGSQPYQSSSQAMSYSPGSQFPFPTTPGAGSGLGAPAQPAVYYTAASINSLTTVTLTESYTGPTNTATLVTSPPTPGTSAPYLPLQVTPVTSLTIGTTASVLRGAPAILFGASVELPAGTALTFGSDPASVYYIAEQVSGTSGVLTAPYLGPTAGAASVTNVTPIVTIAQEVSPSLVNAKGQPVPITTKPFGDYGRLGDVLFFPPGYGNVAQAMSTNGPVMLIGVPADELVP